MTSLTRHETTDEIASLLQSLDRAYAPTPLRDLTRLAAHLGVAKLLGKDETSRMLGNFKSLGGTYAGLRALARAAGLSVVDLLATRPANQPCLVCASDGNHGLAVATAARFAGTRAYVFLHEAVPFPRAERITGQGANIRWVAGTYDDAVAAAIAAAHAGLGLLVADTTDDPSDPVVLDVMAGYGVMAAEIRAQVGATCDGRPTHLFVQAGVGGLAAAMAGGLANWLAPPGLVVAVEPAQAACLAAAFAAGGPVRVPGDLQTAAEMLSCGEASAPALATLRRLGAHLITVSEATLGVATTRLSEHGGPATTASGAAGLAGLMAALADDGRRRKFRLDHTSRVLIMVTESVVENFSERPSSIL